MNRAITWTPEIDAALLHYRAAGLSMNECSRRIGISHPVLARRCRELDVYVRTTWWTPEMDAQLRGLRSQGHSWLTIGRRMALSENAVRGRAWRLKMDTTRRPVWNGPRDALLRRLRADGVGWRRVSREIGLSTHACRMRAIALGIPRSAAQVAYEVGHPSNTAGRVPASTTVLPPKTGRSGNGAASFEGVQS